MTNAGILNQFPSDPGTAIGAALVGLGVLLLVGAFAYMYWQIARVLRAWADRAVKDLKFREILLDRVAKKKGIDIDREVRKMELFSSSKLEKRIQAEILAELEGRKVNEKNMEE